MSKKRDGGMTEAAVRKLTGQSKEADLALRLARKEAQTARARWKKARKVLRQAKKASRKAHKLLKAAEKKLPKDLKKSSAAADSSQNGVPSQPAKPTKAAARSRSRKPTPHRPESSEA